MTDEQIIKALECCYIGMGHWCSKCPFSKADSEHCEYILHKFAHDLINRQAAEIENLKQIIDEEDKEILKLQKWIIFWREDLNYQPEKIKSEAIKEFAKWLKEKLQWDVEFDNKLVFESDIDNHVKEMAKEMTE